MPQWVEGIDYQVEEGGKVKCLHCEKLLEGKAGLGPHLSSCPKRKSVEAEGGVAPTSEGKAAVPEEAEVLQDILIKFGMKDKRAAGVADLLAYAGWNNFAELKDYCGNCGMNPDRILLVVKAWSNHRGVVVPVEVFDELQRNQQYPPRYSDGYSHDEDRRDREESRDREKDRKEELKEKEQEIKELAEKMHALELTILKTDMDGKLSVRDDRIGRLESRLESVALQTPPGKSVYDLLDKGITMADKRVGEGVEVLRTSSAGKFNPEVKYTSAQRREKAEEIEKAIMRKEGILDAKGAIALALADVLDEKVESPQSPAEASQMRPIHQAPDEEEEE